MTNWLDGSALDRQTVLRADPERVLGAWGDPAAVLLRVGDASVETNPDGSLAIHPVDSGFDPERHYFLGRIEGRPWFATRAEGDLTAVRTVMDDLPPADLQVVFTAVGIAAWHAGSGFCPRCGAATKAVGGGQSRRCTACGTELYPRTDPAVIVAMIDPDGRLLLGRQPSWAPGRFSVFAGFVEIGESLEQAVHREMAEEVGLELSGLSYLGSQPWPFPRSLMVGFVAHAAGIDLVPAPGEIEDARWFSTDELRQALAAGEVALPPTTSIARRMIDAWLDGTLLA